VRATFYWASNYNLVVCLRVRFTCLKQYIKKQYNLRGKQLAVQQYKERISKLKLEKRENKTLERGREMCQSLITSFNGIVVESRGELENEQLKC
jgi:hypothetical protein